MLVKAEALRPIVSPEMEDLDHVEPGQPYTFVAEIEVRPELTLSAGDDFTVRGGANDAGIYEKALASERMARDLRLPAHRNSVLYEPAWGLRLE